jgi:hypothetical protein
MCLRRHKEESMPPTPQRGSATLSTKQLAELRKIADSGGRLVHWFPKGQPVPDAIAGAVIAPREKLGATIDRLVGVKDVGIRLDVFPLGIVNPEEFLVQFEHGFGAGH